MKAVEVYEKVLDKNHPYVALSYDNLSTIYKAMERLKQSAGISMKAVEIREKVLDKNHPYVATSYNNLSTYISSYGRLKTKRWNIK